MLKRLGVVLFLLCLCSSCIATSIISSAINNGETIFISVQKNQAGEKSPSDPYYSHIIKNGDEYELHVAVKEELIIYKLPINKLNLLKEIENSFDQLKPLPNSTYYLIKIQTNKRKRSYRINTDIIKDFIGGLKKK